jgi:catechol 2,3-dioxygenase-like lactoylglutathione lyase family enzyme
MSTLSLLEHVNLNVPNHDYILDFYINILGCGLDPRTANEVNQGSGTVWCNAGASQFHLPYGEEAQVIPGSIGLWYDSLDGLKERLAKYEDLDDDKKCFAQYSIENKGDEQRESVRIMDNYGNVFFCRKGNPPIEFEHNDGKVEKELIRTAKQPIITTEDEDVEKYGNAATQYGLAKGEESECKGISYIEILVPRNKAGKIAEFYECVFDATTTVFTDPVTGDDVTIVAFGFINPDTGRSSQTLLFRESDAELPPYDGHHIALYVGSCKEDFEEAFKNVLNAQVLWVNPRFSDKVTNLNTAKKWKQLRFKNITDLKTGKPIIELEHEVRSVENDAWPGK